MLVTTDDPGALLTTPGQAADAIAHSGGYHFSPANHGQLPLSLRFAKPGPHQVTLQDSLDPTRQVRLSLTVSGTEQTQAAALASQPRLVFVSSTPSFSLALNSTSTNAGVQLSLTVTALDATGARNSAYRGTVAFSSTDPAFSPGTAYRYAFTSTDAGQHVFPVSFNTAGSAQTITVTDTQTSSMTGTSPSVGVAETYLSASVSSSTVAQGTTFTLTLAAKDGSGALVSGYRGTVAIASLASCLSTTSYAFTSTDAGQHALSVKFNCAGSESITVTDQALPSRNTSVGPITVTNTAPAPYTHEASPSGVQLADGSLLVAYLDVYGRLSVRRNVGTVAAAAWQPAVLVRDTVLGPGGAGYLGADTPMLVAFNGKLALFHSYSDGSIY